MNQMHIPAKSPLRTDTTFNNPPSSYVIVKKDDVLIATSTEHKGWTVEYPIVPQNEFLVSNKGTYKIEIWDNQWKDKLLFSLGPYSGDELLKIVSSDPGKNVVNGQKRILKTINAELSLSYAGTQVMYRLKNVTIPNDSPHRKAIGASPSLCVSLKRDGEKFQGYSTNDYGWSVEFPKDPKNIWPIREGCNIRYTIEVWSAGYTYNTMIFNVTGCKGEDFQDVIREELGKWYDSNDCSTIIFERVP